MCLSAIFDQIQSFTAAKIFQFFHGAWPSGKMDGNDRPGSGSAGLSNRRNIDIAALSFYICKYRYRAA
jgi:hypothetical protein